MRPILVVGSYNTGLTMRVDSIPGRGETVLGTGYSEGPGGKGSNQAVAAARLGGSASFVGCVGRDRFGDVAFRLWEKEGVDSTHVRRTSKHTGLGFVIVDGSGANSIAVDPGANMDLAGSEVARAAANAPAGSVMLLQLEIPIETVNGAIRAGRKSGMTVILNPAPPVDSRLLDLSHVDVITPNEAEFLRLAGTSDLKRGTGRLLDCGVRTVVVTLGARGSFVRDDSDSFFLRPPRVKAVDTTGAGDAFSGALAVAISEGKGIREAVQFANAAGALTVTKREVIPALPTRGQVDSIIRRMGG
ncbi:MAG TPA: ribokinase [Nitrososphaerales archaeon]|nr:ribokinase [Nitrososphaerales archaeon]